jgi:carbon storage regulator CsrA
MEDLTMAEQGSLTFTREPGDCFAIGEDITISIVKIRGDKVRVNIKAPKDLRIARDNMKQDCNAKGQHEADGQSGG